MIITFFTDPHLGLKRMSHTTARSQQLYRDTLYKAATAVVEDVAGHVICLGDLFDTSTNDETTILQGLSVSDSCSFVLAGNHDIPNREGVISSLKLIESILDDTDRCPVVISPDPGKPYYRRISLGKVDFFFIPHCLTQEIFEQSLEFVIAERRDRPTVLCLHCNVGDGFGPIDGHGSSLWLTSALQKKVSGAFDYVLVGHEHETKTIGNIVVLGNTYPVSFSEMGDRFKWELDTETMSLTPVLTQAYSALYSRFDAAEFIHLKTAVTPFIEVTGTLTAADLPSFSRALLAMWKNSPELIGLKNSTVLEGASNDGFVSVSESHTLPEIVAAAVTAAGFEVEYQELLGAMK